MIILKDYIKEIESIFNKRLAKKDKELIQKAYFLAEDAHKDQMRDSGDPFFEHPKEVGRILANLKMDIDTVVAGLLHDVVEDCDVPIKKIQDNFGKEISTIVNGVTKISNLKLNERLSRNDLKSIEKIETIRKMLLAMSTDIRVIIVKLSDRLHNMRTLDYVPRKKQIIKSEETLKIYAPIAHRLGIHRIKAELQDLSFKYLHPDSYISLKNKLEKNISSKKLNIDKYIDEIKNELKKHKIKALVEGREKHIYSIWEKMLRKGKSLDQIYDFLAIRIITENQNQCYAALGIVHSLWTPIPRRIKDFIATPKFNGYRSIHTTVLTSLSETIEVQIRDWDMHEEAEYGLAAHWAYKEGMKSEKLNYVKKIMEMHNDIAQIAFDMKDFETNLISNEIFVFTPDGAVIHLPNGATPIDFAYAIHTDIGNHYAGAKVNGRIVPISYQLQTGEVIEILVNRNFQGPSIDWLKHAKSAGTKRKIKKYYRQKNEPELIERGKTKIKELSKKLSITIDEMLEILKNEGYYLKYNIKNEDDLYIKICIEDIHINTLKNLFQETTDKDKPQESEDVIISKKTNEPSIMVNGEQGVDTYFAKCCFPVPGDEIIGIISKRGIGIHRKYCKNISEVIDEKKVEVEWSFSKDLSFTAILQVEINDKSLKNTIRNIIKNEKGHIEKFEIIKHGNVLGTKIRMKVNSLQHLYRINNKLSEVNGVISLRRV